MKRGISPVIAAVLLVIIAVAAGVLVWTWISGFASKNPTQEPTLQERIKIDSVSVNRNTGNVTIYVRNIGATNVSVSSAEVLDAVNGNTVCISIIQDVPIPANSVKPVNVTDCVNKLMHGHPYVAKVVTARGTEATYQFVAP